MTSYNDDFDQEAQAREQAYHKAMDTISNLGYNTTQEMMVDMLVEGEYSKDDNEWIEFDVPSKIQTNRNQMNLAQAKFYGVKLIRIGTEEWDKRQS